MGSIGRQLNRVEAKKYYKIFCKDWSKEKLKRANTVSSDDGKTPATQKLGQHPSFNQWLQVLNKQMADALTAKIKEREAEKAKLTDSEWKEEEVAK